MASVYLRAFRNRITTEAQRHGGARSSPRNPAPAAQKNNFKKRCSAKLPRKISCPPCLRASVVLLRPANRFSITMCFRDMTEPTPTADRSHLLTEQRLPESMKIDATPIADAVNIMLEQDRRA